MGRVKSGRASSLSWQRPSIRTERRRLRQIRPLIEQPLEQRRTRIILRRRRSRVERATYTTLEQLKMHIEGLGKARFGEFRRLLDERELALVKRRIIPKNPETQEDIGKRFSISKQRVWQIERELLEKIGRWRQGKRIGRKMIEGRAVRRIKTIITRKMLLEGKTLSEIKKEARLTEFQCAVLDIYVILEGEKRITREEAAKRLGKELSMMSSAMKTIEEKLAGAHRRKRPRKPRESKRVKEIREMVEKLCSQGKTIEEIKSESGFYETQIRVLDRYVLSRLRIKQKDAAKRLRMHLETLKGALRIIKRRLREMMDKEHGKISPLADKL
jgi:hypothetical protein